MNNSIYSVSYPQIRSDLIQAISNPSSNDYFLLTTNYLLCYYLPMISWSGKRQLKYLALLAFVFLGLFLIGLILKFYTPATCFDGKQNQGELGVDCGGPCSLVCENVATVPTLKWARVFKIKDGVFSAFAYVQNPNKDAGSFAVPYEVKLYDSKNVLVYSHENSFYLPSGRSIGVLEANLRLGDREPVRADFDIFDEKIVWQKEIIDPIEIYERSSVIKNETAGVKVNAEFVNRGTEIISNLNVVAIVYDGFNNALGASKTVIETFNPAGVEDLVFVWPEDFGGLVKRVEYLYWIGI